MSNSDRVPFGGPIGGANAAGEDDRAAVPISDVKTSKAKQRRQKKKQQKKRRKQLASIIALDEAEQTKKAKFEGGKKRGKDDDENEVTPVKRGAVAAATNGKKAKTAKASVNGNTKKGAKASKKSKAKSGEAAARVMNADDDDEDEDEEEDVTDKDTLQQHDDDDNNHDDDDNGDDDSDSDGAGGSGGFAGHVGAAMHMPSSSQVMPHFPQPISGWWDACPADVFAFLIQPITPQVFFSEYWEKKPLLVRRKERGHFDGLFSSEAIDAIVRQNYLKYGVNLDLTKYEDGERTTLNPDGRVRPNVMWAMFEDGCSVRVLNPQTFHQPVWKAISALQDYFGCMVGANTYLTPKGTQGFAPHYDDIEAFILQLEGEKRWRLYDQPEGVRLPRHSSPNYDESELGKPYLDVVLRPGDLLYFPRGVVHQAVSLPKSHSLHLTLSTYQLFDWAQYMQKLVPQALANAIEEDADFRSGLPRNSLDYVGLSKVDENPPQREKFIKQAKRLMAKLPEYASFDAAADQVAVENIHNCMPPCLSHEQQALSGRLRPRRGFVPKPLKMNSFIRIISPRAVRLMADGNNALLYHSFDNGMHYHAEEPQCIEFPLDFAEALEQIVNNKEFFPIRALRDIPEEMQLDLVTSLYDAGLLLVQPMDDEDEDDDEDERDESEEDEEEEDDDGDEEEEDDA
ncbi:hypothetical protein PTSG_10023 [Salpingoeca rosetta]|uniref:Bifunctional lysine-specific demethylase and histidyl-hydroxylase n=1 Tax=Salpingoeca rosetta (strain ATCC 50818 / BSB-021) TaxID=946362 RepID=F2UPA2_SALR5|nr:uncharacterized protein PTSG_10023 [Salpingoeca rosetta]EGD79457.1 hypothetical protein PTSG_10023 [Salpingoeca rosetta]|eukprot:XP_004988938.1 hypothetical protein PTSG_10023 [Salpingoeca rosetta]